MRITQRMMTHQVNGNMSKNLEKLMKTQNRISSGKQINRASDDPAGMGKILGYRKTLSSIDRYLSNISEARSGLEAGESTLSEIGELLTRAKELALSQATDSVGSEARKNAAQEVRQIREQLMQLANTRQGDRYMFGGRKTDAPPYDPLDPEAGFQGDDAGFPVMVADDVAMNIAVSGKQAFGGTAAGAVDPVVVLSSLIQGLEANDTAAVSAQLNPLDQALNQIIDERVDVGALLNRLDATESHLESFKINIQQMLSDTQDLDLTQAATELTAQQTAYQASLSSSASIIQYSLLDYLR